MEQNQLRRISFSCSSSPTLTNFDLKKDYKESKRWEWLDLSDCTGRLYGMNDTCSERDRNYRKRGDEKEDDNESFIKNWSTTSNVLNNSNQEDSLIGQYPRLNDSHLVIQENLNLSADFSNDLIYQDFDDFSGENLINFYQTGKRSSFESQNTCYLPTLSGHRFMGLPDQKLNKNNKLNNKIGIHQRPSNTAFTSSNIYLRPLPANFTPLDLHELCMSMVRSSNPEKCRKFHILSVKVMIEEEDKAALGTCKGFGFCLWNSVQASAACIEGLRAHGYQASFARESSRGMLSSLADPTSANIYLSNLPHNWGEDELKALFGDTPIASARLLRDRDDEAVGSGASRGVGFVRLACRSDALYFVELMHGMPIPGTNCHLQCRMADSQAQKEWKRNVRSSFKQSTTIESSPQKNLSRDSTLSPSSKKWSIKKPTHDTHANVGVVTSDQRGSVGKSPHQRMPPSYSEPDGIRGGFHVVGLSSSGGPVLIPPFHAPSSVPGPIITGTNNRLSPTIAGNEVQRIFPIAPAFIPVYPPAWYPQQGCPGLNFSPGSSYSSMNNSPYPQNRSNDPYDPHSPPPHILPQRSFIYYHPDSPFPNFAPQNDQFNDIYDSNKNLNLNIVDQSPPFTLPLTTSTIQEFYPTDSKIKISDQILSNKNPLENGQEEEKEQVIQ